MEPMENNKVKVSKNKGKRKALKIIFGIVLILLLLIISGVAVAVPAFISSMAGNRFILAKANSSGIGSVGFADLSMSWGKGINISKLTFKNTEQNISVAVKEFSTRPNYGELLTGTLSFGQTVIDEPKIEIKLDKIKQKPVVAEQKTQAQEEPSVGLPIQKIDLVIKDGDVTIQDAGGPVQISQINSSVNLRPEGQVTDFRVEAKVGGAGTVSEINASGQINPGKNWDLKKTSGNVSIEVNTLDLSSLDSILAIAGVDMSAKGTVSINIKGTMTNGAIENLTGDVTGNRLDISAPPLKGDAIKTNSLNIEIQLRQQGDLIDVGKFNVQTDWLSAKATGTAPINAASLNDFLKPDSKYNLNANLECDIPAVAAQLPNTLGINKQTQITAGKLIGSVQTSQAGEKKLEGQLSIEGLAGTVNGRPISLSQPVRTQAQITYQNQQLNFEKLDVTSAFANINCTGSMEAFDYDAQVDISKFAGELGQFADLGKYKLAGQLSSKGRINNDVKTKTLAIVSSTNISMLQANPTADITINEPNASIDIDASLDNATNTLAIKQLKADTSIGQVTVTNGELPLSQQTQGTMSMTVSAKNIDLAKIRPYLVMSKAISKDVRLSGIAESDVTVGAKEGVYTIKTDSTKITNLMIQSPGKAPFTQNSVAFILDAEVNPQVKSWKVGKMEIISPDIKIKGTFEQKIEGQTGNMQGNAELDYDWKTLSGMLSAFMPTELTIEGKRKDTISFSSQYSTSDSNQMLANLNAQAKIGFDKAGYMGLNIGQTNVEIKVDKGLLVIPPFTSTVNNGQFNFGGSADFKQKPSMFKTSGPMNIIKDVQINDEMMNKLMGRVNPVFLGALNTSGIANFDTNQMAFPITGGSNKDVDITGTVSLTEVKMQPTGLLGAILSAIGTSGGQLMTIQPTQFIVNDGFVRYQNMQMDIGTTPINFAGAVPLDPDREIESFSVVLPVNIEGKIIKQDSQAGTDRLTAYIKGTPKNPKLDLGKMVEQQLIQKGLQLLLEKTKP